MLPSMVPEEHGSKGTITVDCTQAIGTLLSGKCARPADCPSWLPHCTRYLVSALSGGQWSQSRKAAVPKWGITDDRCQLCLREVGTLEHRHTCSATMPVDGWNPPLPDDYTTIFPLPLTSRERLLRTRGLLAVTVERKELEGEWFTWIRRPPATLDGSERWYIDGSALDTRLPEAAASGFAIVVVTRDHAPVAFGYGCPPPLYTSAAAAEAFALEFAITQCSYLPAVVTDCKSLLDVISAGIVHATKHKSVLARVWVSIYDKLQQKTGEIQHNNKVTWMPAHQPVSAIWSRVKSDGRPVSPVDWRANRLVDALAKLAAVSRQSSPGARATLTAATRAVRFAGLRLGLVSYWANNLPSTVVDTAGKAHTVLRRDAFSKNHSRTPHAESSAGTVRVSSKRRCIRAGPPCDVTDSGAQLAASSGAVGPATLGETASHVCDLVQSAAAGKRKRAPSEVLSDPRSLVGKKRRATMKGKALSARLEAEATARRVTQIGAGLQPPAYQASASQRSAALRERILAKQAGGVT